MYWGELAALATALSWSFTAVFFSEAGRLVGSFQVNKIRLVFALVIYAVLLLVTTGLPWPQNLNGQQMMWLGLSGLVGYVFGDGCGFKAHVMIGPRLSTLIMASTPIMTTVIAWLFLGERLALIDLVGIGVTITGIVIVASERKAHASRVDEDHPDSGTLFTGILLALGAALGQAVGLVLSKQGMLHAGSIVDPLTASYVRILAATPVIWLLSALRGKLPDSVTALRNNRAMAFTLAGAIAGPFLGVWLSLIAVSLIHAGVASTLNSMTPVLIIPTVMLYYKERVSARSIVGAVVAVSGVALLFLG